jgi:N-acetylglucosaminyl-diphospho-decaprenol L-rhamnosyltransferase
MISIVVVNWNSGQLLERCVQSLLANAAGCQILIVDNASTDSSLLFADKLPDDLTILRNDRNMGFAAASNSGWRAGKGDYVLFLNPDAECLPGSVRCLEQTFLANSGVWAAGGRLINPSGQSQSRFNVRTFPSVRSTAAELLFFDEIWPANRWICPYPLDKSKETLEVDQPAAACLMVSRTALESIEGFDESFHPAWFEDVDLCRRIRNQGGRILYQPQACFRHHGGYSLGRLSRKDFLEIFHTNQIRYFKKHHGLQTAFRVKRLIELGLILRSVLSFVYPLVPNTSRGSSARIFRETARRIASLHEGEL